MGFPGTVAVGKKARLPLNETVFADGDESVGVWEDEGGATANLWQSVDSESDADWIELRDANRIPDTVICPTTTSRLLRLFLADPSGVPSPDQTVELKVRVEYVELLSATGEEVTLDLVLREGATVRATNAGLTVTQTPTERSLFLSTAQINSIGDWDNLSASLEFDACAGDSIPNAGELDIICYRCRLIFSP